MSSGRACDVLIIGAGPAGTAAASVLADAGIRVLLTDQHNFPREKVCGDGLIPDAMRALDALGVGEQVRARAYPVTSIRAFAPNRTQIDVPLAAACLSRLELDQILLEHALAKGVELLSPLRLVRVAANEDEVNGAVFEQVGTDRQIEVSARLTLLATGAASHPLEIAGLCTRKHPSGFAARAYFEHKDQALIGDRLCISFDAGMCPGYGWIFPMPGGLLNVGTGYFHDGAHAPPSGNVRSLFNLFMSQFPIAQRIAGEGRQITPLKGAPLRTGLEGARFGRPGLLAIGEASGSTYALSGEGIGKAMETAMFAARLGVVALSEGGTRWASLVDDYATGMNRDYRPRFRTYAIAQDFLVHPKVVNFLAGRAATSPEIRKRLGGVLTEEVSPRDVFKLPRIAKTVIRHLAARQGRARRTAAGT